jgi:hypothetical protein
MGGSYSTRVRCLFGKPEWKISLRPRRRWEDNIRMDLREIGWEDVEWMYLSRDRDQWRTILTMVVKLKVS